MLAFPQRGEAGVCRIGSAPFDLILNGQRHTTGYPHFARPVLALIPGSLASAHKRVQLLRHMIFKSHQDIVKRGQTTPITWQTFDVNLVKTVQGSGACRLLSENEIRRARCRSRAGHDFWLP